MINKIRHFFGWHTVESLQSKSGSILDVFNKTVDDLSTVNNHINNHVNSKEEIIMAAKAEQARLNDMKSANTKIIDKINSFLN